AANCDVIEDKQAFSDATAREAFHLPTWPVRHADELEDQLDLFHAHHRDSIACVKPRRGVNGHGFWKLTNVSPTAHLMHPEYRDIRSDMFLAALRAREADAPISPLVLMEYLPGPEVSFDILAHKGQILKYVARTKYSARQAIQSPHFLESEAVVLAARFTLHGLVNLQFRKARDGSWKILEINARPAGGSIYAEDYGSSLIADWGGLLTGRLSPDDVHPIKIDIEFEKSSVRRLIERTEAA
ncbi:MAG: ATP-grasp domain-containing protein, partial [Pseudomonadota bacterium]|nr:ATP-grasp domain-containing protein [Pseudomonadota bacterium]